MTSFRAHPLASAVALLRQALSPPGDANASVAAALVGILAAFWNLHVVLLLILVVAGGIVDLWTGSRRARIRTRLGLPGGFDRTVLDEGASGKGAILAALLFMGVSIDSVLSLAGGAADLGIGDLFRSLTPATAALLAYRLAKEIASVKANIEETPGGRDAVWPGVGKFVDALRAYLAGGGSTDKRWGDHLTPEERAWIDQQLSQRRGAGGATSTTPE